MHMEYMHIKQSSIKSKRLAMVLYKIHFISLKKITNKINEAHPKWINCQDQHCMIHSFLERYNSYMEFVCHQLLQGILNEIFVQVFNFH